MIEVQIDSIRVSLISDSRLMVLKEIGVERFLSIWIGQFEVEAIAIHLRSVEIKRPMTHDLLKNVVEELKGAVQKVVVSELRDNTFYALVYVETAGDLLAIDARPSDAIALALRARAPILVEEAVIDSAKSIDFSSEKADSERLQKWLESLDPEELGKYKM